MAQSANSSSGTLCISNPAAPAIMIRISTVFTMRTIAALSRSSASCPDKCRKQEKRKDEQSAGNGTERRFLLGVLVDAVNHQHHHRRAEQIVVECAQELGDENWQEAPGA